MKRRQFLKLGGLAGMAAVLPVPALGAFWPKSEPLPEKGELVQLSGGINPSTYTFWRNRPDGPIDDLIPPELVPKELQAAIDAEGRLAQSWWALSDLTVYGRVYDELDVLVDGEVLYHLPSSLGVQRVMWPPDKDLLFPAERRLSFSAPPRAWCAIVRAPHDSWFIASEDTAGHYVQLNTPRKGVR